MDYDEERWGLGTSSALLVHESSVSFEHVYRNHRLWWLSQFEGRLGCPQTRASTSRGRTLPTLPTLPTLGQAVLECTSGVVTAIIGVSAWSRSGGTGPPAVGGGTTGGRRRGGSNRRDANSFFFGWKPVGVWAFPVCLGVFGRIRSEMDGEGEESSSIPLPSHARSAPLSYHHGDRRGATGARARGGGDRAPGV